MTVFHIAQGLTHDFAHTWCGVPIQRELDVLPREASAIVAEGQQFPGYERCVPCFTRLMLADFEEGQVED